MDKTLRNILRNVVTQCRRQLEEAVAEILEGQFGIYASGKVDDANRMEHLSADDREYREQLLIHLQHVQAASFKAKDAVEQLVREVAFTHLNRFCAYKMMEHRGLIRKAVSDRLKSQGFLFYLADHPEEEALYSGGQQDVAYQHFLEWLGSTLSEEIGVLFSPHDPANRLLPTQRVLDSVLDLLNSEELKDIWVEDETIGWVYQYFTPKELRDKARKESQAPRNSYELAFRNQFYTPSYVVQFLTDNTLGRIWYEMRKGETALKEQCKYFVRRPNEVFLAAGEEAPTKNDNAEDLSQEELLKRPVYILHRPKKDPRSLKVLDPACGSGHFLLYCFALLLIIYEEAYGDSELGSALQRDYPDLEAYRKTIPGLILAHNLHGIDIDIRATQIAALALWLRAQRAYQEMGIKKVERPKITKSNIVCAEPMPGEKELLDEFVTELQPTVLGQLVQVVFDKMKLAGEAGSLLKIEEELREVIAEAKRQWKVEPKLEQLMLFPEYEQPQPEQLNLFSVADVTDEEFWNQAEGRVVEALQEYANRAIGSKRLLRQLFADDAVQGLAFVDICRERFDVVLMNPPFGDSSTPAKHYSESSYSTAKADLGMAFVDRGLLFCNPCGLVGAITSRVLVANDSLEDWRENRLLAGGRLRCFIDLGYGVLDEAMVEAAAYTISTTPVSLETFFLRVLDERDKENAVRQHLTSGDIALRTLGYWSNLDIFEHLPGKVLCYWLPHPLLSSVATRNLVSEGGNARHGLVTTDDFRFLRLVWEVPTEAFGRGKKWVLFAKGGEYQPYWDDLHLALNWENDGAELKSFTSEKAQKTLGVAGWSRWINAWDDYFKPGLTFPERTTSDFSPRVLPADCIFSSTGQAIFFKDNESTIAYLAGAYTRHFKLVVDGFVGSGDSSVSGSAAKHYRSGLINALPPSCLNLEKDLLLQVLKGVNLARSFFTGNETSRDFISSELVNSESSTLRNAAAMCSRKHLNGALHLLEVSWHIEPIVATYLGFRDIDADVVNTVVGVHPMSYPDNAQGIDLNNLRQMWTNTESNLISCVVIQEGARRQITKKSFFGNRRLELLSHLLQKSPKLIVNVLSQENLLGTELIQDEVQAVLSYVLGCVSGRWDVRIAQDSLLAPKLLAPFETLPIRPPGTLVSPNGLPATIGNIVSEEWLRARPDANTLPPEGTVRQPTISDSEYPIPVDWKGILVDDPDHPGDIINRVRDVLEVIWGDRAEAIEQEACEILGVKELRDYFRKPGNDGFWTDHIKRYSKSRRKAPIYWLLQSSKKNYALWIYYHRLDKDILFKALVNYVEPKLRLEESNLEQLRSQKAAGTSGKVAKQLEKQIDRQEALLSELRDFQDKLHRAANLNLEPDLNDGVVLNIAPLWELVPWSEAKKYWEELIAGKYEWSSIGKQLRQKGIV